MNSIAKSSSYLKLFSILLLIVFTVKVAAQTKISGQPVSNTGIHKIHRKAVFTYKGNFFTHHDTVEYLKDTSIFRRYFSLIKLRSGEIREVPVNSIKMLDHPSANMYVEL